MRIIEIFKKSLTTYPEYVSIEVRTPGMYLSGFIHDEKSDATLPSQGNKILTWIRHLFC